jgi:hypothetical protein
MLFDPKKLLVLAGPCSLENETVVRAVARRRMTPKLPHAKPLPEVGSTTMPRASLATAPAAVHQKGNATTALQPRPKVIPSATSVEPTQPACRTKVSVRGCDPRPGRAHEAATGLSKPWLNESETRPRQPKRRAVRIWQASWMITLSAQLAMAANASTSMSRWKCAPYETPST